MASRLFSAGVSVSVSILMSNLAWLGAARAEDSDGPGERKGTLAYTVLFANEGPSFYRIPSIVVANDGTVLAFCNRRVGSAHDRVTHVELVLRRSKNHGKTWLPMQDLRAREGWVAVAGSALVDSKTGEVMVQYGWQPGTEAARKEHEESKEYTGLMLARSTDSGETWRFEPMKITPNSVGKTGEACLAELPDGTIYLNSRSCSGDGRRKIALSHDGGETFEDFSVSDSLRECNFGTNAALLAVPGPAAAAGYLGPVAVVAAADGKMLFVAAADAKRILMVDIDGRKVSRSIGVPASPTAMVLSPRGKVLYVSCAAPQSTVCGIDVASGNVSVSIPVGHTATGLTISPDGKSLYVCNRFSNNVSVIDVAASKETARVPTTREPVGAAITPDGKSVFVINHLANDRADSSNVAAEVTVIDTSTMTPSTIRLPNGSSSVRGVCASPDGESIYAVHILSRYQLPTTQLDRGWVNANALSIIDAAEKKHLYTLLLDDVELGAANPWGVATSADGKTLCVTHSGTHEISVIDTQALMKELLSWSQPDEASKTTGHEGYAPTGDLVSEDLAFLIGLRRRLCLRSSGPGGRLADGGVNVNGLRGLAVVGTQAYVASYFTDSVAVVGLETKSDAAFSTIALGPEPELTVERLGEMLFHDAEICFQHWQSCASCHPDGRIDGLNWDLMNDGIGNPKNVRSMLLAHQTPPAMSSGVRATTEESVRAGILHILFAVRAEEEAVAMDEYCKSLEPVPSPYLISGKLSPAAEHGKKLFFDEKVGCAKCHPPPLYTDKRLHDVGSRGVFDHRDTFDTPTLIECWRTAPYMHDGHYVTLNELFSGGRHGYKGTDVGKLSEKQLSDLIEFVLSL